MMADPSRPKSAGVSADLAADGRRAATQHGASIAADMRPTEPQRRYLRRGLNEPGGKLPLFDRDGRAVSRKTVEACIAHGWAAPWIGNPIKPDWLVCRLTVRGYGVLGESAPDGTPGPR